MSFTHTWHETKGFCVSLSALMRCYFSVQQVKAIERFMRRLEFHLSKVRMLVCVFTVIFGQQQREKSPDSAVWSFRFD